MKTPRGTPSGRGRKAARKEGVKQHQPADDGELPRIAELEAEYELLGELGRGGTAVVYLARDRELGRKVAIKIVRATYVEDEEASARLRREAQTIAGLQHPNIVMLYGTRRLRDRSLALVMQYIEGHTLRSELQANGPLTFERATQVLNDMGNALAYAHAHRIVHRDIKPENIYIDHETGMARLSDFGIARPWGSDSNLTLPGSAIGTPAYMSPEQIDGAVLDGRSDIYSLGLVGHELLSGTRPWAGETLFSIIVKQKHEELPALTELRPGIPDSLRYAIEGATRKLPDHRFQDAEHFVRALSGQDAPRILVTPAARVASSRSAVTDPESLTVKYDRTSIAAEVADRVQELTTDAEQARVVENRSRRRQWSRIGAAAGVLIVVGVGVAMAFSSGTPELATLETPASTAAETTASPPPVAPPPAPAATSGVPKLAFALFGDRQVGVAGDTLRQPLVLRVEDEGGRGVAGISVRFAVVRGEGTAKPATVTTDAAGSAVTQWVPHEAGEHTIEARITGLSTPVSFYATVNARPAATVAEPPATPPPAEKASAPPPVATPALPIRRTVALGGTHTCQLAGDGVATCWGGNDDGQLGDGSSSRRAQPVRVSAPEPFSTIAAGVSHACGVAVSGAVYCWGANRSGQLGDGTRTGRPQPVRLRFEDRLVSVAVGAGHSCALDASGRLFCWGQNSNGQLGDGTTSDRPNPVRAGGNRAFRAVVVGWAHTCALSLDGAAFCWGRNGSGELGDGGTRDRAVPAPVNGAYRFTALAAGSAHTCGLLTTGSIRCWGQNSYGQLGNGTTDAATTPSRVTAQETFSGLATGGVHSCALTREGAVHCWGRNTYGQLGDGTTDNRPRPGPVTGNHRFTAVFANGAHTCATLAGGPLHCWGYNLEGQLGDATRSNQLQPVPVGGQN